MYQCNFMLNFTIIRNYNYNSRTSLTCDLHFEVAKARLARAAHREYVARLGPDLARLGPDLDVAFAAVIDDAEVAYGQWRGCGRIGVAMG